MVAVRGVVAVTLMVLLELAAELVSRTRKSLQALGAPGAGGCVMTRTVNLKAGGVAPLTVGNSEGGVVTGTPTTAVVATIVPPRLQVSFTKMWVRC